MKTRTVSGWLCHSPIFRRAAVILVALTWSTIAFSAEIHDAAMNGDLEKVKALLKDNPDLVSSKDTNGQTPMFMAAFFGRKDVAEFLLTNKAEVNAKDNNGDSPLHFAAANGHKDVAELLLANKAEVDARDTYGQTPLFMAASFGRKNVAELLLANKADVDAKDTTYGQTPLSSATANGYKDVVELLLANKADVNAKDNNGDSPLHFTAWKGYKDVAELLLANKANVNARDKNGKTPLHLAAGYGNEGEVVDLVELLLANKADVNAKDKNGKTALMYAATAPRYTMGDAGSLNALIAAGADVTTMALNQPMLIEWNSFSASLATQADIDKLAQPPGLPPGDPSPNSSFIISGYQGNGDGRMMSNPLFVAEDAVDLNGKAIGISKFTLKAGDPAVDKIDPGRWTFSMSEKRGEQIYYFDGGYGGKYLIRVGSEITLPAKQFVIVGGRNMRKGKVIVKKEGLEIEPGTEIFQEEWPKLPGAMPHP